MNENISGNKIVNATKWSTMTEIGAKLVTPVTNMILARLLAPEAFGVVATITMIISFTDMFTDSGFQKYLIQHEFNSEENKYKNANVAFWTNFCVSLILWIIIILFRNQLAILVGNPGLGNVVAVACMQLPITSISSIQIALYRREFDFKTLFLIRIVTVCCPFIITIPLALIGLGYWALIIGNISSRVINSIILTLKSKWKPKFFYSISTLKDIFSFSMWSFIESISIWLSIWVDTLIIGTLLSSYYLGLYKTSISMVNALTSLVTASIVPVLFATLSRLQNNKKQFEYIFYKFQRFVAMIVLPIGIGVYLYQDIATQILLGAQWQKASKIIGIWALTRSIKIVFGDLCSEVYRSKGKPKLSFIAQILHLVVLVPTCVISAKHDFWTLVYARSWIQVQFVLVHFLLMRFVIGIPILKTIKNVIPMAVSSISMGVLGYILKYLSDGILWSILSIFLCVIFYFAMLFLFPNIRLEVKHSVEKYIPDRFRYKYILLNILR